MFLLNGSSLFEICLGMRAGGADLGGSFSLVDVTAVEADPVRIFIFSCENGVVSYRLQLLGVLFLMLLFNICNKRKARRNVRKALLLCRFCKLGVHFAPFEMLTARRRI